MDRNNVRTKKTSQKRTVAPTTILWFYIRMLPTLSERRETVYFFFLIHGLYKGMYLSTLYKSEKLHNFSRFSERQIETPTTQWTY